MNKDTKIVLLFCLLVALSATLSLRALAVPSTFGVLSSFPVHHTDRDEPEEARARRVGAVASAIDQATDDPTERAALATLVRFEAGLARYVQEGRCSDGPRGKHECDSGRSIGLFQLRPNDNFPTVPSDLEGQAVMALRIWRGARVRCRSSVPDELAGAFSQYGSGNSCGHSWAEARASHVRKIRGRL